MADKNYTIPENPAYRVKELRQLQDTDPASATQTFNPLISGILESVEHLNQHKAELSEDGKVPPDQLPEMDYVPNVQKGQPEGVASLDETGKVPESQLPALGGHIAQATAPDNTNLLWVDTSDGNILKFYHAATETWEPVGAVWS